MVPLWCNDQCGFSSMGDLHFMQQASGRVGRPPRACLGCTASGSVNTQARGGTAWVPQGTTGGPTRENGLGNTGVHAWRKRRGLGRAAANAGLGTGVGQVQRLENGAGPGCPRLEVQTLRGTSMEYKGRGRAEGDR